MNDLIVDGVDNDIKIGRNVRVGGKISGNGNRIIIDDAHQSSLSVYITGDNNQIVIGRGGQVHNLSVFCGNHIPANGTRLNIGPHTSFEPGGRIFLNTSGNKCAIGRECLISSELTIRCGESPHLIFDVATGKYLDQSNGVSIGDHVWIGEQVYVTKNALVAADNIIAACSVVTRQFKESNSVIAGNPAVSVKSGVKWVRNVHLLEPDSIYANAYNEFLSGHRSSRV